MTELLPQGLEGAFLIAAAELGMASAARLFVAEVAEARERNGIEALRDALGREFPVLDFVATAWLEGRPTPAPDPLDVLAEVGDLRRLLVVGMEADALDRLIPALPGDASLGLTVGGGGLEPDAARAVANYRGRLEVVPLAAWDRWAGARSGLLTFVYGSDGNVAYVAPSYLRLIGPDVRTSFRSLVGWDILGGVPRLYPRFLAGASLSDFSIVVPQVGRDA